jgi:hypothetical protein
MPMRSLILLEERATAGRPYAKFTITNTITFQFAATHAVSTDGVSFSTGAQESPRSCVT